MFQLLSFTLSTKVADRILEADSTVLVKKTRRACRYANYVVHIVHVFNQNIFAIGLNLTR